MQDIVRKIREINDYIKDNFLKLSVVLFAVYILIAVISYFVIASFPTERINEIVKELREMLQIDGMEDKGYIGLFCEIFFHNLKVSGINIVSAIIPFLFFPLWSVVSNGLVAGAVFGVGAHIASGEMFLAFLKFVLPHAIFEIPIFILSCAMGLKFCILLIKKLFGKAKNESLKYHFDKVSEILIVYIIPFLLIAAFLEGVVEPWIFGM